MTDVYLLSYDDETFDNTFDIIGIYRLAGVAIAEADAHNRRSDPDLTSIVWTTSREDLDAGVLELRLGRSGDVRRYWLERRRLLP